MSATLFVEFRGNGFWAYDIVAAVFLKHVIDAAVSQAKLPGNEWLEDAVDHWRIVAVGAFDCGLDLDNAWTPDHVELITKLASDACGRLRERDEIPTEEIGSWRLLEDHVIWHRGLSAVATASAINLGNAIIQLISGQLPEPPAGTWWFFANATEPHTVGKRVN